MFNEGLGESFGELYPGARQKAKGGIKKKAKDNEMSKGKREERIMSVGYPLSQGTFLGHGECPVVVGHRAACRATSHLHHGEIMVKAWGKSGKVGG